ncbi:MAG: IS110 family transposase [Muribaculaceae bacterium]|nr:IS110 family transposase [Muribaculaceae bacterium]
MQIYGIDLASEKFDVSFVDSKEQTRHIVVKNTRPQIEKFLDTLPGDCRLVAEHTGVYGDMLLKLADIRGIAVSYVSGYEIKHSLGLIRGKSDPVDASRIREYGERYADRLEDTHFPSATLYELKELYATRRLLVQQRKQLQTVLKGDGYRPEKSATAQIVKLNMVEQLSNQIASIEDKMVELIDKEDDLSENSAIAQSIPGIGPVTATELIIKTDNFKRVSSAKKCATLAGIAPFPNSTGKTDKGSHVSHMGDKQLKSLLFMCARSAVVHFEKMRVYKMKKYDVEHKHIFVVLNNVANRLLKILYALIKKGEMYNPQYLPRDPRLKIAN